jgi:hypothetical protein
MRMHDSGIVASAATRRLTVAGCLRQKRIGAREFRFTDMLPLHPLDIFSLVSNADLESGRSLLRLRLNQTMILSSDV